MVLCLLSGQIRKRDWSEHGQLLRVKINTKLSVYQSVARLQIKALASLDLDGKSTKRLLHFTLFLLIEAAEACLQSMWRKLRVCEELFSSLLAGISQAAVTRGGQLLRVLLIRFKRLVLVTCEKVWFVISLDTELCLNLYCFYYCNHCLLLQAETLGSSQGAMFQGVLKTSCEIIEFGWTKDRSPVDTFIMGLAACIRERNDSDEKVSAVEIFKLHEVLCYTIGHVHIHAYNSKLNQAVFMILLPNWRCLKELLKLELGLLSFQ